MKELISAELIVELSPFYLKSNSGIRGLKYLVGCVRVRRMKKVSRKGKIIIPACTADILLDGIEYEIKSPFTNKHDKLERNIKRELKKS